MPKLCELMAKLEASDIANIDGKEYFEQNPNTLKASKAVCPLAILGVKLGFDMEAQPYTKVVENLEAFYKENFGINQEQLNWFPGEFDDALSYGQSTEEAIAKACKRADNYAN